MKSNKTLIAVLVLLLLLLLGLGGLFLWLTGGQGDEDRAGDATKAPTGIVHVRSIYTANGENLLRPVGIGADADGNFFVTLRNGGRVVGFDRQGDWIRTWGERGLEQGQMMAPVGVAVDPLADHVYVTDRSRLRIICYSTQGRFLWENPILNPLTPVVLDDGLLVTTFGPLVLMTDQGEVLREVGTRGYQPGQFDYPRGAVQVDHDSIVVADSNNTRVQRVRLSGETTTQVEWVDGAPPRFQDDPQTRYGLPSAVALDSSGRAFVLDGFKHEVAVVDPKTGGRLHTFTDLQGKSDGRFNLPTGMVSLGDDYFAITDTYNDRVQIVRLIMPSEDNVVRRNPWVLWLLPLLLLALLAFLLGRKRWYATGEALEVAASEQNLRLLAAVARKVHVLPDVAERYEDHVEEGVRISDYLVVVEGDDSPDDEKRLVEAARPTGLRRLTLPRIRLIAADDDQARRIDDLRMKAVTYRELDELYSIGDADGPGRSVSDPSEEVEDPAPDADSG